MATKMENSSKDSIQAFLDANMKDFSDEQKILIKAQFLQETCDEKAKSFALKLFSKSASTYMYLLGIKCKLPPISSIYEWHMEQPFPTGISEFVLDMLKHQAKMMTVSDRRCLLVFDEMAIKSRLRYDVKEDLIHGYHDHGEFGRDGTVASKALVFSLRGLNTTWRQTISYYIGSPKSDTLSQLIVSAVKAVKSCGMEVVGTCCDQFSTHVQAYAKLMENSDGPWVDIEEQRIFLLFDYAHLFKTLRNLLIKNPIRINSEVIDYMILVKMVFKDQSRNVSSRLLSKDTKVIMFPNQQKLLSTKIATQFFSEPIYSAIRMSIILNVFESDKEKQSAESTAVFFEKIDSLLDNLNTGVLYSRSASQEDLLNSDRILNDLKEAHQWMATWCSKSPKKFSYFREGFSNTLLAITKMWDYLKDKGQNFVLLSNLSMDICKDEFIKLRTSGGLYERNPPAWRIVKNFKELVFNSCIPIECSEYLGSGADRLLNSTEDPGIKVKALKNNPGILKEDEHQDIDEHDLYYDETSGEEQPQDSGEEEFDEFLNIIRQNIRRNPTK